MSIRLITKLALFSFLLLYPNMSCVTLGPKTPSYASKYSAILTIGSIAEIMPFIESADSENTLVLWDFDDTLIMPTPEFNFRTPLRKKWVAESEKRLSKERRDYLISQIWLRRTVQLVEPITLNVLLAIKAKEVPNLALTGMYTGKFGRIENIERWRINELLSVGIDFSDLSSYQQDLTFPELRTERGIPMLISGVIFTALTDKAIVFDAVRRKLELRAKTIIFIDDDLQNVTAMQKLCEELHLNFYGFVYTATKSRNVQHEEILDKMRLDYLEKHGEWPSF